MTKIHLLVALAVAACGGADTPAPENPEARATEPAQHGDAHADGHHGGSDEGHAHDFPAEVTAFHDVMSPLWHAEAGDARRASTCDAVAKMTEAAGAIEVAEVPDRAAGDAGAWREASAALTSSLAALGATCADASKHGDFDAAFKDLHDKFHVLVALVGHQETK